MFIVPAIFFLEVLMGSLLYTKLATWYTLCTSFTSRASEYNVRDYALLFSQDIRKKWYTYQIPVQWKHIKIGLKSSFLGCITKKWNWNPLTYLILSNGNIFSPLLSLKKAWKICQRHILDGKVSFQSIYISSRNDW